MANQIYSPIISNMKRILFTTLKSKKIFQHKTIKNYSVLTKEILLEEQKKLEDMREQLKSDKFSEEQKKSMERDIKQFEIMFKILIDPTSVNDIEFEPVTQENPNLGGKFQ
jgi:negative regulator of replication initiation